MRSALARRRAVCGAATRGAAAGGGVPAVRRLFSYWHVLHIPLFFMLLIAGIVHVIAVNMY